MKNFKNENLFIVGLITLFVLTSTGVAFAQESQIIITPNRFVVLDDPNAGTKAPGFYDPMDVRGRSWGSNYWSGESTTIRASAQVLRGSGAPQSGVTVTFTLKNPGTTVKNTAQSTTDNKGIAYYSFDLNGQNYWGYWTIEANATVSGVSIIDRSSFALNWWGCTQCHGSENPGNWGTKYTPKSYYTMGYDFHRSQSKSKHTEAMSDGTCIICHTMYNGTPVNWRFSGNTPNINPDNEYSPDWHKGKAKCQDCHAGSNTSTTPQGKNPEIAGCYDTAGCHAKKNNNVSNILSTTGYAVGGNYRINYSFIPNYAVKAHNSSSIPCITCHNAGHNITKPYNTTATSNSYTEYQQCTACHQTYTRHNDNVSCTVCHSQDAHAIKIFTQNATYATGITNPARGDCTNCHQNSTFQDTLESQPKAGSYTGRNPPQIPTPFNHSTAPSAGQKWGNYWDNNSAITACYYCHQNEIHKAGVNLLGNVSTIQGSNTFNNPDLANSTWCANCHYGGASEYKGNLLANPPPEITDSSLVASDGTIFFNHNGLSNFNDSDCKSCHGSALSGYSETSLNLSHSVSVGGGDNCILCHGTNYIGAPPSVTRTFVNISAFDESIHQNINSTPPATLNNVDCWACHYNKDMQRENVKKCGDCHRKPKQWHGNADITTNLSDLW